MLAYLQCDDACNSMDGNKVVDSCVDIDPQLAHSQSTPERQTQDRDEQQYLLRSSDLVDMNVCRPAHVHGSN